MFTIGTVLTCIEIYSESSEDNAITSVSWEGGDVTKAGFKIGNT